MGVICSIFLVSHYLQGISVISGREIYDLLSIPINGCPFCQLHFVPNIPYVMTLFLFDLWCVLCEGILLIFCDVRNL